MQIQLSEDSYYRDFRLARKGKRTRRGPTPEQQRKNRRIKEITRDLDSGRLQLLEFLQQASGFFYPVRPVADHTVKYFNCNLFSVI